MRILPGGEIWRFLRPVSDGCFIAPVQQFGHRGAEYAGSNNAGVEMIVQGVEPGDMILTLGAGSVSQLGEKILEELTANAKAA